MPQLNTTIDAVTELVCQHSAATYALYLLRMEAAIAKGPVCKSPSCTNRCPCLRGIARKVRFETTTEIRSDSWHRMYIGQSGRFNRVIETLLENRDNDN